jgi:hypothetical protein
MRTLSICASIVSNPKAYIKLHFPKTYKILFAHGAANRDKSN